VAKIFDRNSLSPKNVEKAGGAVREFAKKLKETLKGIGKKLLKYIAIGLGVGIAFILVILIIATSKCSSLKGTCIEADEFGQRRNTVRARPTSESDYVINNAYKHEKFTQKTAPTDLGLSLTGEPVTINISGGWLPWFGDLDNDAINAINPPWHFFCALEKRIITNSNYKFSNRADENEYYFIRNYYSGVVEEIKNDKIVIEGVEDVPERQKECWLNRGAGLYLGSFGLNGKTEPSAYHHMIASKMVCSKVNWFNGKAKDYDYEIMKYNDNTTKYLLKDFVKNYFSLSHYTNPTADDNELNSTDRTIMIDNGNQIIYNIAEHETLLMDNQVSNYGLIVAHSMAKFGQACYKISKDSDGLESRSYKAYYQFGPKILYKNLPTVQNIKYTYGERVKMLIVDKYYGDNQGYYNIEVISGIELDDSGFIEKKIREVEFYLLGTPRPGSESDRVDGIIYKIFHNILSSRFILFVRAILALSVVIYGFRVAFGFKIDKNSKSVINKKDLMMRLFKLSLIVTLTSENAFTFFSSTILNFVINGTIGVIDLIAGIFSNSFMTSNDMSLTGGLRYANEVISLSRNFAIVDEIIGFFTDITLFSKILSLVFVKFPFGTVVAPCILLVLAFYLSKLIQSIVPFIFVLVQFTLVLPLAPLFMLFGFFEQTKFFLQNWLKFVFSKCLELVGFFIAFYFCTSIIDNFIKKLLSFRVCFVGLGDMVFKSKGSDLKWYEELAKTILNLFIAVETSGIGYGDFFMFYCINVATTAVLVILFDLMTKEMMTMIGGILTIDGATATMGGGENAMMESTNGTFGLSKQLVEFAGTTGLSTLQKEADALSWTKGIYDLEKGIGANAVQGVRVASTVARAGGNVAMAMGRTAVAGAKGAGNLIYKGVTGKNKNYFDTKKTMKYAKANMLDAFRHMNDVTGGAFGKDSVVGTAVGAVVDNSKDMKLEAEKLRKTREMITKNTAGEKFETKTETEERVNSLLSANNEKVFRKKLKKFSPEQINEVFSEEAAEKLLQLKEDDFIEDDDEIDNLHVARMREYLEDYMEHGKENLAASGVDHNVFSDNFRKKAQPKPPARKAPSKPNRLGEMLNRPVGGDDDKKYLLKKAIKLKDKEIKKVFGEDISKRLKEAKNDYKNRGKYGIDDKFETFTTEEYEEIKRELGNIERNKPKKNLENPPVDLDSRSEPGIPKEPKHLPNDDGNKAPVKDKENIRRERISDDKKSLESPPGNSDQKPEPAPSGEPKHLPNDDGNKAPVKDEENIRRERISDDKKSLESPPVDLDSRSEPDIPEEPKKPLPDDDAEAPVEDDGKKEVDSAAIVDSGDSSVVLQAGEVDKIIDSGDSSSIIKAGEAETIISATNADGDEGSSKPTKEEQFKEQQEAREKMDKKFEKMKKQQEELEQEELKKEEKEKNKK
jgi:hypothetical protein